MLIVTGSTALAQLLQTPLGSGVIAPIGSTTMVSAAALYALTCTSQWSRSSLAGRARLQQVARLGDQGGLGADVVPLPRAGRLLLQRLHQRRAPGWDR